MTKILFSLGEVLFYLGVCAKDFKCYVVLCKMCSIWCLFDDELCLLDGFEVLHRSLRDMFDRCCLTGFVSATKLRCFIALCEICVIW